MFECGCDFAEQLVKGQVLPPHLQLKQPAFGDLKL
jgi:hypothetical protein